MTSAWRGTVQQALSLNPDVFVQEVDAGFRESFGQASQSEVDSWRESLLRFLEVLRAEEFGGLGLIVEFRMPVGEERADVVLIGGTPSDRRAYVLELKQWTNATPAPDAYEIDVPGWGRRQHASSGGEL